MKRLDQQMTSYENIIKKEKLSEKKRDKYQTLIDNMDFKYSY
ncbi:Uncharacterised protein [Chlamydia abortus]|nr:Uncharacterised protein [Chlamydia abortus]SGA32033.1 Uncharacterised protein [Chlamydia abortus]